MVHEDLFPIILIGGLWAVVFALAMLFNYGAHRNDEEDDE
jgi:hypothetical protein